MWTATPFTPPIMSSCICSHLATVKTFFCLTNHCAKAPTISYKPTTWIYAGAINNAAFQSVTSLSEWTQHIWFQWSALLFFRKTKLWNVIILTNCVPEARAKATNPRPMTFHQRQQLEILRSTATKLNLPDTRDAALGLLHLLFAVL